MRIKQKIICFAWILLLAAFATADWRNEYWSLEPFSGQYGGGPTTGPIQDAGLYSSYPDVQVKYPGRLCEDGAGRRFFENNGIQIIEPNGMSATLVPRWNLTAGFRDGPSKIAKFHVGSYLGNWNFSCDRRGCLYIDDAGNQRIRKLFKNAEGRWMVTTFAGGGNTVPNIGDSCAATQFKTGYNIIVAADWSGRVVIAYGGSNKIFRIDSAGLFVHALDSLKQDASSGINVVDGDADTVGNVYFITRQPGRLIKVDSSGRVTRYDISAYFESIPTCVAAAPEGDRVYLASSKTMQVRCFPMNATEPITLLCTDGRFHDFSPSKSAIEVDASKSAFTDSASGTFAYIAQLHGKDLQGNLYVSAHGWESYGISGGSSGLCPTRIAKLVKHQK